MEENRQASLPRLLVFDVYETILDMSDIARRVNTLLDSKRGYTIWFELCMQYTFVDNCTVQFHDFYSIASATLRMSAQVLKASVTDDEIKGVLEMMKHLPVKEGVQEGLSGIADQNFRIAALTNSPAALVMHRMEQSGLISYFEEVLSAEGVHKYKPSIEVYRWAAHKLGVEPEQIMMVTSHGWDIAGAKNAGFKTAYLQRSNQLLYPLAPTPDLICRDVVDLCEQLRIVGG
jgi:2-haloacid dehalogenase